MSATRLRLHAAVFVAISSSAAHGHHSQAMFDMARVVTVDGVVLRYEWANPHVYIFLEQTAANDQTVEWKIEAVGPAVLRRLGWSRETLGAGDEITVTGNPDRGEESKSLNLLSLRKGDEVLFDSQGLTNVLTRASDAPAAAAATLDGTWATLLTMEVLLPLQVAPRGALALTAAGQMALETYDERTMSPALECIPQAPPFFMYVPDIKRIATGNGAITIAGEYDATERTIDMDAVDHEGAVPSLHGHSIGRWEGGTLVIDTAAFASHRTGNAFGVPSGEQKRLVERLTPSDDGTSLTYRFELSDPEFLAAPVTGEVQWAYRPEAGFEPQACSEGNARRFTEP